MKTPRAFCPPQSRSFPDAESIKRGRGEFLIDRLGAPIPTDRCFKCNCGAQHEVRQTFASTGGYLRILVLLQPLLIPFLLPFHLRRQNRVSVAFGLCRECREQRVVGLVLGALFLFGSVPLFLYGFLTIATTGPISGIGGASLFAAGLLTMFRSRHLADSKYLDGRWIVLRGGGARFLRALPQAPASSPSTLI